MGDERHREDPHPRPGHNPKLTLAGRLDGSVNGRPLCLVADGDGITIVPGGVGTLLTLFRMRRSFRSVAGPLWAVLARANVRLDVRVGWLGRVRVLPDPPLVFRLLIPRS